MGEGKEKQPIPGTNPDWKRWLPDDYDNSLLDDHGNPYDNGWNFDEKSDDGPEPDTGEADE